MKIDLSHSPETYWSENETNEELIKKWETIGKRDWELEEIQEIN